MLGQPGRVKIQSTLSSLWSAEVQVAVILLFLSGTLIVTRRLKVGSERKVSAMFFVFFYHSRTPASWLSYTNSAHSAGSSRFDRPRQNIELHHTFVALNNPQWSTVVLFIYFELLLHSPAGHHYDRLVNCTTLLLPASIVTLAIKTEWQECPSALSCCAFAPQWWAS